MNEALLSQLFLKDTAFHDLMRQHITNVLLIASTYDAFMMEEDGRVEEQIFFEYMSLNLSSPPRVTRVSNYDEAFAAISVKKFERNLREGERLQATLPRCAVCGAHAVFA